MIHRMCERLIQRFVHDGCLPIDYREWSIYVLEFHIQGIISFLFVFVLGCLMYSPSHTLAFLLSLSLINSRSGGFHCTSFFRCLTLTTFTSIVSLAFADVLHGHNILICFIILCGTVLLFPAPLNNSKMHFSSTELINSRKKLRFNQYLLIGLIIFFSSIHSDLYIYIAQGYFSASLSIPLQLYITKRREHTS